MYGDDPQGQELREEKEMNRETMEKHKRNLAGQQLRGADLSRVRFSAANLCAADLSRANLSRADLRRAQLYGADLRGADGRGANLRGANLVQAYLDGANLRRANLRRVDLRGADMDGVDLRGAALPAPTMILLANWENLAPETTLALMRFEASALPHGTRAFNAWAGGGPWPYQDVLVERATGANFQEAKELWSPGRPPGVYKLMAMVLDEKCPGWDK